MAPTGQTLAHVALQFGVGFSCVINASSSEIAARTCLIDSAVVAPTSSSPVPIFPDSNSSSCATSASRILYHSDVRLDHMVVIAQFLAPSPFGAICDLSQRGKPRNPEC